MKCLRRFQPIDEDPTTNYTDDSMQFIKACENLHWYHEIQPPHTDPNRAALLKEQYAE